MSYLIGKTLPIDLASGWMRLDWLVGSQNVEISACGAWRRFCNFRAVPAGGSPDRYVRQHYDCQGSHPRRPTARCLPDLRPPKRRWPAGHSLEISDASGSFRHSLTEKSFYERTNKDFTDEVNSVSKSAQFEGHSFAGSLAAEVPAAFAGNTPEEAFALLKKTQLFRLVDVSEKVLTRGHEEEPKRPDDIAPDLAAVRAELAKCIAAETAARGQIAYLTKWLEDNEKLSEVALDAERNRSDGIARDLAAVRAELADRITAEASARNEIAQLTKLLESSEKEWATKLNAERVSDGKTLATVRAELADRITAEASARKEIEQLTKLLATNEKEWATKLNAERNVSDGKTISDRSASLQIVLLRKPPHVRR